MFKNHIKYIFRNLTRHKAYSAINIFGLAIALACVILILLWIDHELSYDGFHMRADHIFMVLRGEEDSFMAPTSGLLAPTLVKELPEILNATGYAQLPETEKVLMRHEEKYFEEVISFTDSHFFEIFSFPFLKGSPSSALEDPYSVVMTEKAARKYFGDEEAFGESIQMFSFGQKMAMNITGILEDIPSHSHIACEIFVPFHVMRALGINLDDWDNQVPRTYILTEENPDIQDLTNKIISCETRNRPNRELGKLSYRLLPLKDIHLRAKDIKFLITTGDIKYVYIFGAIAFIIVIIACVNTMNLFTALSLKRTKEIGVRKVVGASRKTLIKQFLSETIVLSFLALLLAVGISQAFLSAFNQLSGKDLAIPYFNVHFIAASILIALLTGVLSGYYPALFLSGFQPAKILKTKSNLGLKGLTFRKGLVIFQFSLSIILIISTIVVFNQLRFIQNSNPGYDKDHILCVRINEDISGSYDVFKNELLKNPAILGVSRTEPVDANMITNTDGVQWAGKTENEDHYFRILRTDYDFVSTYHIEVDEGRFYSRQFSADETGSYVINQEAAKMIGLESPVGEEISLWGREGTVIGVLKDFHFGSFHTSIEPLICIMPTRQLQNLYLRLISIRFKPGTLQSSMKYIQNKWKEVLSNTPYNYYFLDDVLNAQYKAEQRMGTLFRYFTIFAIIIACLGLYGLASFSAEQKIKEIGIRKVLGATVSNITVMLSKEFLRWVILANLIAWPISWFMMNKWLQNFAYRASINWWIFFLAGGIAFGIALITVSVQAIRAATTNPVNSLRYE